MSQVEDPSKTTTALIWEGVEEDPAEFGRLQPPWPIPTSVAIKADVGHHFQAAEVIDASVASVRAGACAVHLHIRDEQDRDSGDLGLWREVIGEIKQQAGDVPIDSGLRGTTYEERMSHIRERLFDICCVIPTWEHGYMTRALNEMREHGVKPEFCIWDTTDIGIAKSRFVDKGLLEPPTSWLLVPSTAYYGMPMPTPVLMARGLIHLIELVQSVDPDGVITVCASGRPSSYATTQSMLLGHHVRPGLGETHWRYPHRDDDGHVTTPDLVADAVAVARALGRDPATPDEYRAILGLAR